MEQHVSSAGAHVLTLSSVGPQGPLSMVLGAAILLVDVQRNLSEILVKNGGHCPVNWARRRQRR